MTDCPDPSVLRRFEAGELDAVESARVRAHVEHCDACVARVAVLRELPTETDPRAGQALPTRLPPDTRIDGFVILEFIEEGGFGEVYLARQDRPIRRPRVALKVIRRGRDNRRVLARFEEERQKLALMDHENIARIHDAGTTPDERPYFVMEYVPGVPITEHCDRLRLSIEERLRLFCHVCEAIQHSHQKSIVHRDIKPSNVLVGVINGKATPKVIDFGVAKALHGFPADDLLQTRDDMRIGTLPYMAPEQADPTRQGVDTRIDVYALGVLLYELLTSELPFDPRKLKKAGEQEMIRQIRDEEPQRPSARLSTISSRGDTTPAEQRHADSIRSLESQVRDDLDWITLKCLEKDRERRYASAEALADDIRRFLDGLPVSVGPPSVRYKMRKFLRRNRTPVAAAAAVTIVLLAGLIAVTALWVKGQQTRAALAEHRATQYLNEAQVLAYHEPRLAESRLIAAIEENPDLVDAKIYRAHLRLLLKDAPGAIRLAEKARREHPDSTEIAVLLASLRASTGQTETPPLTPQGAALRTDRLLYYRSLGIADHEAAIVLLDEALSDNPWYRDAVYQLAQRLFRVGNTERLMEVSGLLTRVDRDLFQPWILEGAALSEQGRLEEAIASFTTAVTLAPDRFLGHYDRAWARLKLGLAMKRRGNQDAARRVLDAALTDIATAKEIEQGDAEVFHVACAVALQLDLLPEALGDCDRSIAIGSDDPRVWLDRAGVLFAMDRTDDGLSSLDAALTRARPGSDAAVDILETRGRALMDSGRLEAARDSFEKALDMSPVRPGPTFYLGLVQLLQRDEEAALGTFTRASEIHGDPFWNVCRGSAHWLRGELDAAAEILHPVADVEGYEAIHLWLWSIHEARGDDKRARLALDAASRAASGGYLDLVARHLSGELSATGLRDAESSSEDRLYASFFLGLEARGRDEPLAAEDLFREAVATGLTGELEYWLALHALGQAS